MCFPFGSGRKGAQLGLKSAFSNSCGLCPPQGLENSLKNGLFLPILAMEQLYLLCHSSGGTLPSSPAPALFLLGKWVVQTYLTPKGLCKL